MTAGMKKVFSKVGLIILILVIIVLGVRAILNYAIGRNLERCLSEARAEGLLIEASSLLPPCPGPENAALLWKTAESLLVIESEDKQLLARVSDISGWKEFSPEEKTKLAATAGKNRKALDLMLEAAGRRCFQYAITKDPVPIQEMPNAVLLMQATRLLAADSIFKAESGELDLAVEQMVKGLKFCRLYADSPSVMIYLIAMANTRLLAHNLNRVVYGRNLPEETARHLMELLDPEWWRTTMAMVFKREFSGFLVEYYRHVLTGKSLGGINEKPLERIYFWLTRPLLKAELIWVCRRQAATMEGITEPFFRNERARAGLLQDPKIPAAYRMARLLLPHLYTVILKEATLEAQLEAARTGLAGKLFRQVNGRYPAALSELVPRFLAEEPVDPFTGQPLVYKATNDGFIVYSLGSNLKDDGGRMSMMTQAVMDKDDDWAWQDNWH